MNRFTPGPFKWLIPAAGLLSGVLLTLLLLVLLPAIFNGSQSAGTEGFGATVIPHVYTTPQPPDSTSSAASGTAVPFDVQLFASGDLVAVRRTDGQGLRLREYPSLASRMLYLADEEELYIIMGGPTDADGYRWWFLESQSDSTRRGWGVEEYLERING